MRGHIGAYTVQEETTLKGHKDIFLLRRLGRYIKPHSGLLWIAALFLGVSLVLDLIRPLILKYVIDTALPSKEIGAVLEMAGAYFGTICIGIISMFTYNYTLERFGQSVIYEIRQPPLRRLYRGLRPILASCLLVTW